MGFVKKLKEDFEKERFEYIKESILKKTENKFLDIKKGEKKIYIFQPFGKQEYPDFLIFTNKTVIPVEIKYSKEKESNPVWNSNLPKANGFYIFGSYGLVDITFFCGKDILAEDIRDECIDFFDNLQDKQRKERKKIEKINDPYKRGFTIYIRRAYQQNAENGAVVDYFNHPQRGEVEKKAIKLLKNLEK